MFMTIPFRMGVHTTIPFYVDMTRAKSIDVNGVDMIIAAEQSTEIQCAVAIALQEALVISARNNVETSQMTEISALANELVLAARNGVEAHSRVSVQNVERLAMTLNAYMAQPDLLIQEVRNTILENNIVIRTSEEVEIYPTIRISQINDEMILSVANGIEIPITKALENINNMLELDLSRRVMKIKHWDEAELDETDGWKVGRRLETPLDLALDIGVLEDDSGKMNLVLYANDGVETIITHPMIIGTIDPEKLGELDPYFIPDSRTE